jgi:hypothetical protein
LAEIREELEMKTDLELFEKVIGEQATINDALFSECGKGKWIWSKSEGDGRPKSTLVNGKNEGSSRDWAVLREEHNAIKDCLLLEESDCSVNVEQAGFYEITACGVTSEGQGDLRLVIEGENGEKIEKNSGRDCPLGEVVGRENEKKSNGQKMGLMQKTTNFENNSLAQSMKKGSFAGQKYIFLFTNIIFLKVEKGQKSRVKMNQFVSGGQDFLKKNSK